MAPSADPTQNGETLTSATETTPLLSAPEVVPAATTTNGDGNAPLANGHKSSASSSRPSSSTTQIPPGDDEAAANDDDRP
ncbi:hypothetical protein LTR53_015960, partial [Teratosphaeriaceae sp. CCFEE 6253]